MAEFNRRKKKICMMCAGKTVDYKDVETLRRYTNEKGKIVPRRVTGTCALHQRVVSKQVKRARAIALMPYSRGVFLIKRTPSVFLPQWEEMVQPARVMSTSLKGASSFT